MVNALPYHLAVDAARAAVAAGCHYFDLTEDVAATREIKRIAEGANTVCMPQCGLAPGFIGIVAHHMTKAFDKLDEVKMRVGALPAFPTNALKYNLTWSVDGLINEYCHPCEAIHDGTRIEVLPMEGLEHFSLDGTEYEAFNTSGGLGTLCETLDGQVRTLDYKTVRYPGHRDLMCMLLEDLQLKTDQQTLKNIMRRSMPATMQDVVLVFVTVSRHARRHADAGSLRAQDLRRARRARAAVGDPDHHGGGHLRGRRPRARRQAAAARLRAPGAGRPAGVPRQPVRTRVPAVAPRRIDRLGMTGRLPEVDIVIEIPRGSFLKRGSTGHIDFVSPLPCPFNYGSVPSHIGLEGDLLDAVVLGPRLALGARVRLTAWDAVTLTDRGMSDDKLVCSARPLDAAERRRVLRFFRFYAKCKGLLNIWRRRPGRNACEGWCGAAFALARAHPRDERWRGPSVEF